MDRRLTALCLPLLLGGCNSYEYFRLAGYVQEGFTNKADLLFIIDNSPSMTNESESLAVNFATFIDAFADDGERPVNPPISEDLSRYLEYLGDRTGNVNFNLGITNTEVATWSGQLLGTNPVLRKTDTNVAEKFNRNLLCDAACINDVPDGLGVTCPGGPAGCPEGTAGSVEEPIEALFMAMCRSVEDPPEPCFDAWWEDPTLPGRWMDEPPPGDNPPPPARYFDDSDILSNEGWLREGSVVIPVIISDEGDQSRRINTRDGKVFPYDEYFKLFGHRMSWAVIGQNLNDGCNTTSAASWGIDRFRRFVNETNGVYIDIAVPDGRGGCNDADFASALESVGTLLRSLVSSYPLRALPDQATIVVTVGGKRVEASEATYDEDIEGTIYSDGWSYNAADNSVVLHGDAVPEPNEDVRIWYLPAGGAPRDLPF